MQRTHRHHRRIRRLIRESQERLAEDAPALERLRHLHELALHMVDYNIRLAVEARDDGATWAEIGQAVGITAPAAQRRYREYSRR